MRGVQKVYLELGVRCIEESQNYTLKYHNNKLLINLETTSTQTRVLN
jgi:hypothetical protein